jgi:8-oxo-dGTP pyrophosphatase MutT (NUDIX family)
MLRRNSKLDFAGGMWVFPGGRVDPADRRDDDPDELAPAARAAVREAHEEADIAIDESSLVVFSHWAPPSIAPKRFATWFFLAAAPEGDITIDGGEIHDHAWLRPDAALAARDALDIELAPPTWLSLYELSRFADVDEVRGARARALHHSHRAGRGRGRRPLARRRRLRRRGRRLRRTAAPTLDDRRRLALRARLTSPEFELARGPAGDLVTDVQ